MPRLAACLETEATPVRQSVSRNWRQGAPLDGLSE